MSEEKELLDFVCDGRVYEGEDAYARLLPHVPDIDVVKVLVSEVQFFMWPGAGWTISARIRLHNGYTLFGEFIPERTETRNPQMWAIFAFKSAMRKFKEIHRYLQLTPFHHPDRPQGK
jgi:hypothetical protein